MVRPLCEDASVSMSPLWLTLAALAVVGAVVAWLVDSDDTPAAGVDIVAEARAALAPSDGIAHTVVRSTLTSPGSSGPPLTSRVEQWATSGPIRYRIRIPDQSGPRGNFSAGEQEIAYANGVQRTYEPEPNTLTVTTGLEDEEASSGAEPLMSAVRSLLDAGKLKDAGQARVGGRTVHRLVGSEMERDAPLARRAVLYVDADTAEPIGGALTIKAPPSPPVTMRFAIDYERLPSTVTTRRLLTITTNARTRVIRRSAG
ncbi:MAG: hypothetical protein JHC84_11065 [Solirubrobacteraceae bacterium]|nr:hypothetical protein [Solirubrobacteraceae bacterium]